MFVPETGVVDYRLVTEKYAWKTQENGGEIRTGARVKKVELKSNEIILKTSIGEVKARGLINCSGLQADWVARMCGIEPGLKIVPFRGEYYELIPEKRNLVKNLIYTVPDPKFPFLGVNFTRMIDGKVEAGQNAVLTCKGEGYKKFSFSIRDFLDVVSHRGFWKLSLKYWRVGMKEIFRSLSKRVFVHSLQRLIPEITIDDIVGAPAWVRAQALQPDGTHCG